MENNVENLEILERTKHHISKQLWDSSLQDWSEVSVSNWLLIKVGLDTKVARQFREKRINGQALLKMNTQQDFASLTSDYLLILKEKDLMREKKLPKRSIVGSRSTSINSLSTFASSSPNESLGFLKEILQKLETFEGRFIALEKELYQQSKRISKLESVQKEENKTGL